MYVCIIMMFSTMFLELDQSWFITAMHLKIKKHEYKWNIDNECLSMDSGRADECGDRLVYSKYSQDLA